MTSLYPTTTGVTQLNSRWSVDLPEPFERTTEGGDVKLWRDGMTIWASAYGTEDGVSLDDRMARDSTNLPDGATDLVSANTGRLGHVRYTLKETRDGGETVHALYTYSHGREGQMQLVFYMDNAIDLPKAGKIADSIQYTGG